jgi:hypothetical protein
MLKPEMDEYPPVIFVILFDPVIQFFDMSLIEKSQNLLFELTAAFAGDDLDQGDLPVYCLFDNAV